MATLPNPPISFPRLAASLPATHGRPAEGSAAHPTTDTALGAEESNGGVALLFPDQRPASRCRTKSKRRRRIETRWATPTTKARSKRAADARHMTDEEALKAYRHGFYRLGDGSVVPAQREPPPPIPQATQEEIAFRHSHWQERRARVRKALQQAGENVRSLEAFDNCGAHARAVEFDDERGGWKIVCFKCKSRYCEPCGRARALLVADNLRRKIDREKYVHVVLTLAHHDRPFADEAQRLYDCFKKLRSTTVWIGREKHFHKRMPSSARTPRRKSRWQAARHKLRFRWQSLTNGGCAFYQVKIGQDARWHHHFHIIARSGWINARLLSRAWHRITGDSSNVHVSRIHSSESVIKEVSRYASRPLDKDLGDDVERMAEAMVGMRGRHLFFTWGNWRGYKLTQRPLAEARPIKRSIPLAELIARARSGEVFAADILRICRRSTYPTLAPPPEASTFTPSREGDYHP